MTDEMPASWRALPLRWDGGSPLKVGRHTGSFRDVPFVAWTESDGSKLGARWSCVVEVEGVRVRRFGVFGGARAALYSIGVLVKEATWRHEQRSRSASSSSPDAQGETPA